MKFDKLLNEYREYLSGKYKDLPLDELFRIAEEKNIDSEILDKARKYAEGRGGPVAISLLVKALNDIK